MNWHYSLRVRRVRVSVAVAVAVFALLWMTSACATQDQAEFIQFEHQWVSSEDVRQLEEFRYQQQRVATPFEVVLELDAKQLHALRKRPDLVASLSAILRVGDRVLVRHQHRQWQLWLRHHRLTAEFKQTVNALRQGKTHTDEWATDVVSQVKPELLGEDLLSDAAFALHTLRNPYPHADLMATQLPAQGWVVKRNAEDGAVTVLMDGGQALTVTGIKLTSYGQLTMLTLVPGNEPLKIDWSSPPQRILVMSDQPLRMLPLAQNVSLRLNEKRIVSLAESKSVTAMQRLSWGPDYKQVWNQQRFTSGGPLGFQMDLSRDEIGQHQSPGDYRRIWILELPGSQGNATTQRQLSMDYRVTNENKDVQSKDFLRR